MKRLVTGLALGCLVGAAMAQPVTRPLAVEDRVYPRQGSAPTEQSAPTAANEEFGTVLLLQQIQELEEELQVLRGQVEELRHEVDADRKAARSRYVDLDSRISAVMGQAEQEELEAVAEEKANLSERDLKAYTAARELLLARDYDGALAEFQQYLEVFPEGEFLPFAHFWRGEIFRIKEKPDTASAMKEFQFVVDEFPEHSQAPAALYKLASLQAEKGDVDKAKVTLKRLAKQYEGSNEARLAERMLEQL